MTVIIPHYDELRERLDDSVSSAIEAGAAEVVVVDDGSRFPPNEVPGARLVHQSHRGISAALNTGLARAGQPWVAMLGCGDLMMPGRFERQLAAGAPAVFSDLLDPDDLATGAIDEHWAEQIWRDNQFSWSTVLCRRDLLFKVGGWNEALEYAVDWEVSMMIQCAAGWTYVPGPAAIGREMPGGHTDRGRRSGARRRDLLLVRDWALGIARWPC